MPQLCPSQVAAPCGSPGQAEQLAPHEVAALFDAHAPPQS
jgi:hypothetical protein